MLNIESIYNKVCSYILNEDFSKKEVTIESNTSAANKIEFEVANVMENYFSAFRETNPNFNLAAERPDSDSKYRGDRYPDVRIFNNDTKETIAWVEVKKDHAAKVYDPRVVYAGNNWSISDKLNEPINDSNIFSNGSNAKYNLNKSDAKKEMAKSANDIYNDEPAGVWNCLGGTIDPKTKRPMPSSLSQMFSKIMNTKTNPVGKQLILWLNYFSLFLNSIKKVDNQYYAKHKRIYNTYFSAFALNGKNSNSCTDDKALQNWLSNELKVIDKADLIFFNGNNDNKPGKVSTAIIDDFIDWFKHKKFIEVQKELNMKELDKWPESSVSGKIATFKTTKLTSDEPTETEDESIDLYKVLLTHYTGNDKLENAAYIQIGDEFYQFDSNNNPCHFKNVPILSTFKPKDFSGTVKLQFAHSAKPKESKDNKKKIKHNPGNERGFTFRIDCSSSKSVWQKNGITSNFSFRNGSDIQQHPIIDFESFTNKKDEEK